MTKSEFIIRKNLRVAKPLCDFLEMEALPGSGVDPDIFWEGFSNLVGTYGPINKKLLENVIIGYSDIALASISNIDINIH